MDKPKLATGDHHYTAFVGVPELYDLIGASQFRLLCTLGLRAHHRLLDFGCGSLRLGRLLIAYLDEGRYFGIDPNEWLIKDALENQTGQDVVRIKKPSFGYNDDFTVGSFAPPFDFIVAHSIFTHTGIDLTIKGIKNLGMALDAQGIFAATFVEGHADYLGSQWVYPDVVTLRSATIKRLAQEADLFTCAIPWYHPTQTWYLFAKQKDRLPRPAMLRYLQGAVLFEPAHSASWAAAPRLVKNLKGFVKRSTSAGSQQALKSLLSGFKKPKP